LGAESMTAVILSIRALKLFRETRTNEVEAALT
jgi:hypothetical protein